MFLIHKNRAGVMNKTLKLKDAPEKRKVRLGSERTQSVQGKATMSWSKCHHKANRKLKISKANGRLD
jgi:hypothetical protein